MNIKLNSYRIFNNLFILAILISLVFFCENSWSKGKIQLSDDTFLTYQLGTIDDEFLNGNVTDIQFIEGTKVIGTAKSLIIKSSKKNDDNEHIVIDFLSLKGLSIYETESRSQAELNIDEFVITDFPHFKNLINLESNNYQAGENFSLKINNVKFKNEFGLVNVSSIKVPKIKQDYLLSGTLFTSEMSFLINKLSFKPNPMNMDMVPALMMLTTLGQEEFLFNLETIGKSIDKGIFIDTTSSIIINMKGGFEILFDFEFLFPTQVLEKYSGDLSSNIQDKLIYNRNQFDQELLQDLAGIQISKLNLSLSDEGLMKPLMILYSSNIGQNLEQSKLSITNIIYSNLQNFMPINAENLIIPISQFLNSGGTLNLNVSPPNPVAIMASLGLFIMPDLAFESLGVSLTHNK